MGRRRSKSLPSLIPSLPHAGSAILRWIDALIRIWIGAEIPAILLDVVARIDRMLLTILLRGILRRDGVSRAQRQPLSLQQVTNSLNFSSNRISGDNRCRNSQGECAESHIPSFIF